MCFCYLRWSIFDDVMICCARERKFNVDADWQVESTQADGQIRFDFDKGLESWQHDAVQLVTAAMTQKG